jgi:oligoendopeptidase F
VPEQSSLTALDRLPRPFPRQFVPEQTDLTDVATVVDLFESLLAREIDSPDDLRGWLADRSELNDALDQVGSILYIRMTCQTDDAERAAAYEQFIQSIPPAVKPLSDRLDRMYLDARGRHGLDERTFEVHDRNTRADVELFRQDNVPLETDEALKSQEYQTICGAMTVEFRGEHYTLAQMGKFLLDPDRATREEAWRASVARRLADARKLDGLFDQMKSLRSRIARNADCPTYRDYMFRRYHRFDYSADDCKAFHRAVEQVVLPVWRKLLDRRAEKMGLSTLRPWDLAADPTGLPPLKPFEQVDELVGKSTEIFRRVEPALGEQFAGLAERGLLDLDNRKGKAPGGYQTTLAESRLPFIFMNAVGIDDNVRTLLHEGGHAFHSLAAADQPLHEYRHAPMEFSEVASMGMELLAGEHLDVFYPDRPDLVRSRVDHLEGVVHILPWVATIDAFQHWLYENPEHTADQRRDAWRATYDRFSTGAVDWSGLEDAKSCLWHRQLHIFEVPFYYIEYAIAQLGALQIWVRAKEDRARALADYRAALALGGSRPLSELFETAGIRFDFSAETIGPLMQAVSDELDALG